MFDFLEETLNGDEISAVSGQTDSLVWHRSGPGVIRFVTPYR